MLSGYVEKALCNNIFKPHVRNSSKSDQATRYLSICGPHAGAFLRALPKPNVTELDCEQFSTVCLLRLGIAYPFILPDSHCDCKSHALIGEFGQHLHTCNKDNALTNKHNEIVRELECLSSYAGIKFDHEPLNCFPDDLVGGIKPDIKLYQPRFIKGCNDNYVLDVSVTHACNISSINFKSDKKKGISARKREISKNTTYLKPANNNNLHFIPVVFETHGRVGNDAIKLIEDLIKRGWNTHGRVMPLSVIREYWNKRISVALQKGNARMLLGRTAKIYQGAAFEHDDAYRADNLRDAQVVV